MSVVPNPPGWPARYIHHCWHRWTTLGSVSSAPSDPVEASRGSKIFSSVPERGLAERFIFLGEYYVIQPRVPARWPSLRTATRAPSRRLTMLVLDGSGRLTRRWKMTGLPLVRSSLAAYC